MTRCSREKCVAFRTFSNRSTRLLLLEQVAERFLEEHQRMKDFTAGFGPKKECDCPICQKAREAFRLKTAPRG